jgi:hypothetical protein
MRLRYWGEWSGENREEKIEKRKEKKRNKIQKKKKLWRFKNAKIWKFITELLISR